MGEYCLKTSLHLFDSNNTLDSFSILLDILFYPYECFLFYTHGGVKDPVWGKVLLFLGKTNSLFYIYFSISSISMNL